MYMPISIDTKVTVGFVIVLLGIAFAWGKLDTKVDVAIKQGQSLADEFHEYVRSRPNFTAVR